MDREEMMNLLRSGPQIIHMADGRSYQVDNLEMAIVSEIAAHVLRRDEDGKLRAAVLPLVSITGVVPVEVGR